MSFLGNSSTGATISASPASTALRGMLSNLANTLASQRLDSERLQKEVINARLLSSNLFGLEGVRDEQASEKVSRTRPAVWTRFAGILNPLGFCVRVTSNLGCRHGDILSRVLQVVKQRYG